MALIPWYAFTDKVKQDLTFKLTKGFVGPNKQTTIKAYESHPNGVYIPRAYIPDFYNRIEDANWEQVDIPFKATPYVYQQQLVDTWMQTKQGVICASTGAGKTVIALYIAHLLGLKTLIIVHTQKLLSQWTQRVKEFCGFVPSKIQAAVGAWDKPITVAMLQTLAIGSKIDKKILYNKFGLVIYDELHRMATEKFHTVAKLFWDKHRLGLSATPKRADGMQQLIFYHTGPIVASYKAPVKRPIYYAIEYYSPYSIDTYTWEGKFKFPNFVNSICNDLKRIELVIRIIKKCIKEDRKIIVLSDRKAPLRMLNKTLKQLSIPVSYLMGDKKETYKQVILGTYGCAGEGVDIHGLDTLIMLTPRANIVQAMGRVSRAIDKDPIVVDIIDMQSKEMRRWYAKKKRTIMGLIKQIKKVVIHHADI